MLSIFRMVSCVQDREGCAWVARTELPLHHILSRSCRKWDMSLRNILHGGNVSIAAIRGPVNNGSGEEQCHHARCGSSRNSISQGQGFMSGECLMQHFLTFQTQHAMAALVSRAGKRLRLTPPAGITAHIGQRCLSVSSPCRAESQPGKPQPQSQDGEKTTHFGYETVAESLKQSRGT